MKEKTKHCGRVLLNYYPAGDRIDTKPVIKTELNKFREIEQIILNYFQLTREEAYRKARHGNILISRQMIHYFGCMKTKLSLATIGRMTGHRNHCTVIHSRKRIGDLIIVKDKIVLPHVKNIEKLLQG